MQTTLKIGNRIYTSAMELSACLHKNDEYITYKNIKMNISKLAEKYFENHTNPIVKTESFGLKLHTTGLNEAEEERKNKTLGSIKHLLGYNRVERRAARATAEWSLREKSAKVTKTTGFLSNFGVQNKNGRFLNPLEALYLLEINKLELYFNNIPLSIQEGFKMIENFDKYSTYKKLSLQGYRIRFQKKRVMQKSDVGEPPKKVAKMEDCDEDIFAKLRKNAPKSFQTDKHDDNLVDFYVKTPENVEFGLVVENNKEYVSRSGDPDDVYALCSDDYVSFYKFYNTNIPIL